MTRLNIAKNHDQANTAREPIAEAYGLSLSQDALLVSAGNNLISYNVASAGKLNQTGTYPGASPTTINLKGTQALALYGGNFRLESIDAAQNPHALLDTYDLTDGALYFDMDLLDNTAYIADSVNGVTVVDIGTPNKLAFVDQFQDAQMAPYKIAVNTGYVVTSGSKSKLYRRSDFQTLDELNVKANDLDLDSNNILRIAHGSGYSTYSLINDRMTEMANIPLKGISNKIAVVNNVAHIAQSTSSISGTYGGYYAYDVANQACPSLKANVLGPELNAIIAVASNGNYAYMIDRNNGIYTFPTQVTLTPVFNNSQIVPGATLSYNASWTNLSTSYDVMCVVSDGTCAVSNQDFQNGTATVNWTLPSSAGRKYKLTLAVGNDHYFDSSSDRVTVP